MNDVRWGTVAELKGSGLLSNSLLGVLDRMTPSDHEPKRRVADISSFVEQVLREGRTEPDTTAGILYQEIALAAEGTGRLNQALRDPVGTTRRMQLSLGLSAAFADAFEIRRLTGGKDEWIGLRHLIVAILTTDKVEVAEERGQAMAPLGRMNMARLAEVFAERVIVSAIEPGEDRAAWGRLFNARGYPDAAHHFPRDFVETFDAQEPAGSTPVSQISIAYQASAVARVRNDDPSSLTPGEIDGEDGAATALARVIASQSFEPPLAVGIFGAWGSGKSFMMRRVENEIGRLSCAGSTAFHSGIATVRFNAWHYVDTDLWANLVGQIFETLQQRLSPTRDPGDGLLDKLTTARELSIESARDLAAKRRAAMEASQRLEDAKLARDRVRSALARKARGLATGGVEGLKAFLTTSGASALVEKAYGEDLATMATGWREPLAAVDAMRRDGIVLLGIRREFANPWLLAACGILALLIASVPAWLPALLEGMPTLSSLVTGLDPALLFVGGLLTTVSGRLALVTRHAIGARDTVIKAMTAYRSAVDAAAAGDGVRAAEAAFEAAELKVTESRIALDDAIATQAAALGDFARSTPLERLKAFVSDKASEDSPYRVRQGLIGTIRRDFDDLARFMSGSSDDQARAVRAADEKLDYAIDQLRNDFPDTLSEPEIESLRGTKSPSLSKVPFDRIVLYIDDLDRCPADKVLEVLQAVHLLMAFRLFVVVVAVDVRWLKGSLGSTYGQLGGLEDQPGPLEYLEKIFQLVIWTEPFTEAGTTDFIRRRFTGVSTRDPGVETSPVAPTRADSAEADPASGSSRQAGPEDPVWDAARQRPHRHSFVETADATVTLADDTLRDFEAVAVSADEVAFIETIASNLSTTPRRLLRLMNSYQVARASLDPTAATAFFNGGYRAFAAMLTAVVIWPECTTRLHAAVKSTTSWADFNKAVRTSPKDRSSGAFDVYCDLMEARGLAVKDLADYADLAIRFSFSGVAGYTGNRPA